MKISVRNWEKNKDETYNDLKYSYVKKKGKHKRAKKDTTSR